MCLCATFMRIAWSAVWLPIWCDLLRVIILCDLLCNVCLPYLYAVCYFLNCIVTFVCMLRVLHGVVWRSWNVSVTSVEGNAWKCLSWLVSWMYWCFLSKEMKEKIKYQFFLQKGPHTNKATSHFFCWKRCVAYRVMVELFWSGNILSLLDIFVSEMIHWTHKYLLVAKKDKLHKN